jgi:hypothetical protein
MWIYTSTQHPLSCNKPRAPTDAKLVSDECMVHFTESQGSIPLHENLSVIRDYLLRVTKYYLHSGCISLTQ